ncbi:3',5'-cyclic-AMP phosphodiesterase [Vibrio sp. JC009]|uniref:3',5'-cyclic-AMP phosphodiesterase n=1 Tax=Vibrio sp. JC009 TaxID=2912314 RepID=UPI0023AEEAB2|nr:3',5'-cyclic-AMP phosphodiesterase [Vibrio sp. JC009]WED21464.1 3',5'-cyclic-AMP phosphodiesterase [Vibrio sp. JC009]
MKLSTTSERNSIKLLQLTDTHLFSIQDGCLLSVNTLDSFRAVVSEVKNRNTEFDAILATGDISQDHTAKSYCRFEQEISCLEKPCLWLPGNHDFKPNMKSVLPSDQIFSEPHVLAGDFWQIISLDSQVAGVPHGRLNGQQLALLDEKLAKHPERHTLILLHHHPVLVGSAWLDQHTLYHAESFWEVVKKHNNVRAAVCGHVHQAFDEKHHGVRVITTPSTCVQFKPDSQDFALDAQSPGWRTFELFEDGTLKAQVHRLEGSEFFPDFNAGGY